MKSDTIMACISRIRRLSWQSWLVRMIWLQTITHVQVYSMLELWLPIIHNKVEVALACLPEPQSDDFIKLCMEIVSLVI